MPQNVSQIPVGLSVASQIPLNFNSYSLNEAALMDLGDDDNLAFVYHKGKSFYCAEEKTKWIWEEVITDEINDQSIFLLDDHFVYPDPWVVNDIDYSAKTYNFIQVQNITVENINDYSIPGLRSEMVQYSATSLLIAGSGNKTLHFLTTSLNTGWAEGTRLRFSHDATGNYMEGVIISGGLSNTDVTIAVEFAVGSGTFNAWNITVCGNRGTDGTNGNDGANGNDGTNGADGNDGNTADMTRTSTDNIAIGTGSKTLTYTLSNNLGWSTGTRLRFWHATNQYMEGIITVVIGTSATINVDHFVGSGTFATWNISIAGDVGAAAENLQKIIDTNDPLDFPGGTYTVQPGDNNYSIIILSDGSNDGDIEVLTGLPDAFIAGFTLIGTSVVQFINGPGITITPTVGMKIKNGSVYSAALEQLGSTNEFILVGNTET